MTTATVGPLLRDWRLRRRLSQLELALDSGVSARHLSFVETGRARPSPEMVLRIAEQLEVPLRERNSLLLAAGYAPSFEQRSLDAPEMVAARLAVDRLLAAHEPNPAAAVDAHWDMVAGNSGIAVLIDGVAPELLAPPVNVLRASLHPTGMAPRIANLGQWRAHLLARLARQHAASADPVLAELLAELSGFPGDFEDEQLRAGEEIVVPLRMHSPSGELAFLSTVTTFGTATDITLAELAIEAFYPAYERTAAHVRAFRHQAM